MLRMLEIGLIHHLGWFFFFCLLILFPSKYFISSPYRVGNGHSTLSSIF